MGYTLSNQLSQLIAARAPAWTEQAAGALSSTTYGDMVEPTTADHGVSLALPQHAVKCAVAAHTRRKLGVWSSYVEIQTLDLGATYEVELDPDAGGYHTASYDADAEGATSGDDIIRGLLAACEAEAEFATFTFTLLTTSTGVAYRLLIERAAAYSFRGSSNLHRFTEVPSFDLEVYLLPRRGYGNPPAEGQWFRRPLGSITVDEDGWMPESLIVAGAERIYLRAVGVDDPASSSPAHGAGTVAWVHLFAGPAGLEAAE